MGRSQMVREADVRAMLRLMGELAELPGSDPIARSRHLLAGLCRLIGARAGTDVISRRIRNGPNKREVCSHAQVVGVSDGELRTLAKYFERMDLSAPDPIAQWVYAHAEAGEVHTRARNQIVDDAGWRESGHYREVRQPCGILEPLIHCGPAYDGRNVRTICLHREDANKPFDERDARLLRLFMPHAMRLLTPAAQSVANLHAGIADALRHLSPRQREVLDGLLAGEAVKQVAARLGLSRHTVDDYVKAIYRKLGVGSRGELMARFLERTAGR